MSRVLTVTLNPAIDVRYNVENFRLGNVNRTQGIEKNAGGKGINVSRIINLLGGDILATGIVGGFTGKLFLKKLNENSIKNNFLESEYETRTCIAIIDEKIDGITEILESGKGDMEVCNLFIKKYLEILEDKEIKVICGSGSLLKGIEAKPFLIKPNQEELEDILGRKLNSIEEIADAARELMKKGAENVMVTLGGAGALLITPERVYRGTFPKVEIKNTVGSGDSTVGGFAYALSQGKDLAECFRLGIACGTTNAMLDSTGTIDMDILNNILPKIEIK